MPTYRDEAVVLRTHKLGEADRIVTLLTRNNGRVRAVAKGVRKTSSRLGARLEPYSLVDVQFYLGKSLDVVSQVETIAHYGGKLSRDYPRWTAGQAMVETAERLTPEERDPATQHFLLLVGGLRTLAEAERDSRLVLDAYLVRSLAVAGWAPSFDACARCGEPGPHQAFSIPAGGSVCGDCRPPGSATPDADTLRSLGGLLAGDWDLVESLSSRCHREGSGLVAAYLQWHLERGLRSLPMVMRE